MRKSRMLVLVNAMLVPIPLRSAEAQRINTFSNTERGGVEVKQVPGRKIGTITVQGNIIPADDWSRRYDWSDMGMPEGLAYKIAAFETVDRERGFDVRAPRIPGFDYSVGVDS